MEIRINTEKDSPQEIKKVIRFLQELVSKSDNPSDSSSEQSSNFTNIFADDSNNSSAEETSMFGMFNDNNSTVSQMNDTNSFSLDSALKEDINLDTIDIEDDSNTDSEDDNGGFSIIPY